MGSIPIGHSEVETMKFTSEQLREVRQRTGLGMVDANSALEKHGSVDAVVDHIRAVSGSKEVFRDRQEGEGRLVIVVDELRTIRILAARTETDFGANTDIFHNFLYDLSQDTLFDDQLAMAPYIEEVSSRLGEAVWIEADMLHSYDVGESVSIYTHNNRAGAAVVYEGHGPNCYDHMRYVAMHVTGMNPAHLSRDDIAEEIKEKIVSDAISAPENSKKPEHIKTIIADGKLQKLFKEECLLDQPFARDPSITVGEYLEQNCPNCKVTAFYRYECEAHAHRSAGAGEGSLPRKGGFILRKG